MTDDFLKDAGCDVDVGAETNVDRLRYAFTCLRTLHESANKRIIELELERGKLVEEKQLLEMQKLQWDAEKVKQQAIIHQTLSGANAQNNKYLEENEKLRVEIRSLREKMNAEG